VFDFYDRTLPADGGYYVYRVKAVKGGATLYNPRDGVLVTIDRQAVAASVIYVSAAAKDTTDADKTKYAVTPAIVYKNVLPADGKLVIYWIKGGSDSYWYGKYGGKIEFSKAELEAATVQPKPIEVLDAAAGSYVFAQAYLEFADGTRENISGWTTGGGISYTSSYYQASDSINYAEFNY
jgi:hypothetical protein